jgi:hypothetical protein
VTASPPKKVKRRVGRPRKRPLSAGALERTSERDVAMYEFVTAYMLAHPRSSKDAAIGAAEDKFRYSRSTVQRRIKPLEALAPVMRRVDDMLRQQRKVAAPPAAAFGWTRKLTKRLAVFFSLNELMELRTLSPLLALKIAMYCEELKLLRPLRRRRTKNVAR